MTHLRLPARAGLILIPVILLLFIPILFNMLSAGNDYPAHVRFTLELEQTGKALPHFLYHVLLIVLRRALFFLTYPTAAIVLGLLCYLSLACLLYALVYPYFLRTAPRTRLLAPLFITLALLVAAPITFFSWPSSNLYLGYISTSAYHNPTITLLKPLALLAFMFCVRAFEPQPTRTAVLIVCAAASALGVLAKPNYAIALLPALGIYTLIALVRRQPINWKLLLAVGIPMSAALIWQLFFYQSSERSTFVIEPFAVMQHYSPDNLLPKFLLSLVFPVSVLVLYWRTALRDALLPLAWGSFVIGAFYTYFLAEIPHLTDGNFTWSGQITLFILFVASMIFLLRENAPALAERKLTRKFAASLFIFALHVICGIAFYLPHLLPSWREWL